METVAALFGAIARGLRGLFDLASMAVGIAPTGIGLSDAATCPTDGEWQMPMSGVDTAMGMESHFALGANKAFDVCDCTSVRY